MAFIVPDEEIKALIAERKSLPIGWVQKFTRGKNPKKRGHTNYHLSDIPGDAGNKFEIILRKNKLDLSDFAVVLGVYLSNSNSKHLFPLLRYDSYDEHTNPIEKNVVCGFHIHYTTEKYQREKEKKVTLKIDAYSKETTDYQDIKGALRCLIKDANFQKPSTLFRRHEK